MSFSRGWENSLNVFCSLPALLRYSNMHRFSLGNSSLVLVSQCYSVMFSSIIVSLTHPSSPRLWLCQYADPVTDLLDQCGVFRARLFRESCVFYQGCYVKDLSRLGRELHKTLILDNSPASYIFHPENAVGFTVLPLQLFLKPAF